MKHSMKITLILISMFFITQLIGIFVAGQYAPQITQTVDEQGNLINRTNYNLPAGFEPPQDTSPKLNLISIIIAIAIAVGVMFVLMRFKAELFLRIWFFVVVTIAIALTLNSVILNIPSSFIISLAVALPLSYLKIFKRNLIVHNLTELVIYPGIAALFISILNVWTVVLLLILISLYDMYAVWHAGFMQKMAKYQIEKLQVFSGFFVPYSGKKKAAKIETVNSKTKSKTTKERKEKVNVAILGGGDVVFPIILAGVVLHTLGLVQALIIALGATAALAGLFYISKKGKFYPAMPFITIGCLIALGVAYLI